MSSLLKSNNQKHHWIKLINYEKYWLLFYLIIYWALLVVFSDVPDSLSGSESGRILPFSSDIRIRPDFNLKKISGSGSDRILICKKIRIRFRPDSSLKKLSGSGSGRILIWKKKVRIRFRPDPKLWVRYITSRHLTLFYFVEWHNFFIGFI